MDGGHRHFHHGQRAVDDEILCRQKCPHLLENVARVDVLECEPVGVHSRQARQVPRSRLPGPEHPITFRPVPTTCSGAGRPVHLSSDLQGRVDDWVDVVLLARERELLRRELKLLVRARRISPLACFFQIPPNIRSSPWCRFIAQRIRDSLPSSESRSCCDIGWSPRVAGPIPAAGSRSACPPR